MTRNRLPMRHPIALCLVLPIAVITSYGLLPGTTLAADRWYVGLGGGLSLLEPDLENGPEVVENRATAATLFLGHEMDDRTSVQLQVHLLGEAELGDGSSVDYLAADGSLLYQFFDSGERSRSDAGIALYGRVGIGYINRDTEASLELDAPVWFGAGAGIEFMLNRRFSLRTEALFYDTDSGAAYASIVGRFGGTRSRLQRSPPPATEPVPVEPVPAEPLPVEPLPVEPADDDGDGVENVADRCPMSARGFPVRPDGCALLDGVLRQVRFEPDSGVLLDGARTQLDKLAVLLQRFPRAVIELHAHAEARSDERESSIVARARLRSVGLYLMERGIAANRLVLRPFGATRPLGGDPDQDNRIEVYEHVR